MHPSSRLSFRSSVLPPAHPFIHIFLLSSFRTFIHPSVHSTVLSSIEAIHSLIYSFILPSINSSVRPSIHPFILLLIHPSILQCSFVQSLMQEFLHLIDILGSSDIKLSRPMKVLWAEFASMFKPKTK